MGLTASGLGRARACPASILLPQVRSDGGQHARWGSIVHKFLADVNAHGVDEALALAPAEHRAALGCIDVEALPASRPEAYAAEVTFRYDARTDTAVEVSRGVTDRKYEEERDLWNVWGTSDLVGLTAEEVVVFDYKTGWADLGPVRDNWQLRTYALMAARAYKRDRARIFIIRLRENGDPWYEPGELDALDLDATAHGISTLIEGLLAGLRDEIRIVEGPHCHHCKALPRCPAKATLAAALGRGELAPAVLDESNARAVYERVQAAREVIERVAGSLEEYARQRPIDLGGGWVYGQTERPSEKIDALLARPVLEAKGLLAAIETKAIVTKDGLQDEVRKVVALKYPDKKPRGILGKTFDDVLAALRAAGAALTTKSYPVMKHRVKAELPAGEQKATQHEPFEARAG